MNITSPKLNKPTRTRRTREARRAPYCHHRLDINALSARHGLPYDPLPLPAARCPPPAARRPPPAAGAGSVYRQATVNRGVIATVLAVVAALLAGYVRLGRKHHGRGLRIAPNEARN